MAPLFVSAQPLRITKHTTSTKIACGTRAQRARRAPISLTSDDKTEANNSNAWAAWQRARSKPEEEASKAPQRDPNAETDFWRTTAKELVPDAPEQTRASTQRAVWGDARDVAAGVDKVKTQLEEELNSYDPDKALDDFRETARELSNSQLDMIDEVVSGSTLSSNSASDTSKFSPSTDAPDFSSTPDFASSPSSSTTETPNIDEPAQYDFDAAWSNRTEVPNSAWVGRDTSVFDPSLSSPSPSEGPTYGSDSTLDVEEAEAWRQAAGFQARDPKAETDYWRDTAKDLIPDTPRSIPPPIEGLESSDAVEFEESPVPSTGSFADYHAANRLWNESLGSNSPENAPSYTDGSKPWDPVSVKQDWGAGDWSSKNESSRWQAWDAVNVPEQEPIKQSSGGVLGEDTAMWMSFARDVTGGESDETDAKKPSMNRRTTQPTSEPQSGLGDNINFWSSAAKEITDSLPVDSDSASSESSTSKE